MTNDIAIPNQNNPHNYLLDTTAFNRLTENANWLKLATRSLDCGFCYYITANQNCELAGMGVKIYNKKCYPEYYKEPSEAFKEKMQIFPQIKEGLKIQRVSSMASLMRNHWGLDGTYHVFDNMSETGQTVQKIFNFTEKLLKKRPFAQHYDAMTAEAALYNHCILVTDDDDLRMLVNEDFPSSAIPTKDLIDLICGLISMEDEPHGK